MADGTSSDIDDIAIRDFVLAADPDTRTRHRPETAPGERARRNEVAQAMADRLPEVVLVMSQCVDDPLPEPVHPPLRFREPGGALEGEITHPGELVRLFEPVDILDGATELVDQNGYVITLGSRDPAAVRDNEYPKDRRALFYEVSGLPSDSSE